MRRYVDIDKIPFVIGTDAQTDEEIMLVTKKQIDELPTADVAEVRHGEWKIQGLCNPKCSLCKQYGYAKDRYCPNCGAKMDGEKADITDNQT